MFEDHRGPKAPWKYIDDIKTTIENLLQQSPEATDQQIAAARVLDMTISRSAVARIRVKQESAPVEVPQPLTLEQLAQLADQIDVQRDDEQQLPILKSVRRFFGVSRSA